jgi:hypothetical protein
MISLRKGLSFLLENASRHQWSRGNLTDPRLRLETQGSDIVITMPGTSYQVTFRKPTNGPGLGASHDVRDDADAPITRSEFLARAWQIAKDEARELS